MKFPQGIFIYFYSKGCIHENGMKLWQEKVWWKWIGGNKTNG